jgi:glycosyltransferase involved in cell wall biosynthesis
VTTARPKLLFLVTEDWYFWSHRLPMARAARDAGFAVSVATRVAAHGERIVAEGFALLPFAWRRADNTPWQSLRTIAALRRLVRAARPDIVHAISLMPVVYGGLALLLPTRRPVLIASLTGLGHALESGSLRARLLRLPIRAVLWTMLRRPRTAFIVQNDAHRRALLPVASESTSTIEVIAGSGVDTQHFSPLPDPAARPITIAFVGRLLASKGIRELVAAHLALQDRGVPVRLLIAGAPDPDAPTALGDREVKGWLDHPALVWLGHVEDVRQVWNEAHVAVLPSHHEGLPLSLLEAAACARPLIATDIPGCRAIAKDNVNALLVPVGDVQALAAAIERLVRDDALRRRLGAASRTFVDPDLSADRIGTATVALYRRMIEGSC